MTASSDNFSVSLALRGSIINFQEFEGPWGPHFLIWISGWWTAVGHFVIVHNFDTTTNDRPFRRLDVNSKKKAFLLELSMVQTLLDRTSSIHWSSSHLLSTVFTRQMSSRLWWSKKQLENQKTTTAKQAEHNGTKAFGYKRRWST